jgi:pimeloyl-ACP methyl ester carboxylesterase
MESLGDPEKRRAFVHTARSVIDPKGQRVDARDRLYLAKDVPTMLIWGEKDRMIPIRHGQRAHEMMPHSRFEAMPGAGHFSHDDDPERFVALLSGFIAETEPADLTEEKVREMLLQTT